MNIQIFGRPRCFDTKKAQRFFKERRIPFQFVDLTQKEMSRRELERVMQAVGGMEAVLDEKHPDAALLEYVHPEQRFQKLLENQTMLKTPIVRNGSKATVGAAEAVWKQWIAEETK